jgi:hypothetical protein
MQARGPRAYALDCEKTNVRGVTAVALVDIGALDRAASELFGGINDSGKGVTVIGVAWELPNDRRRAHAQMGFLSADTLPSFGRYHFPNSEAGQSAHQS